MMLVFPKPLLMGNADPESHSLKDIVLPLCFLKLEKIQAHSGKFSGSKKLLPNPGQLTEISNVTSKPKWHFAVIQCYTFCTLLIQCTLFNVLNSFCFKQPSNETARCSSQASHSQTPPCPNAAAVSAEMCHSWHKSTSVIIYAPERWMVMHGMDVHCSDDGSYLSAESRRLIPS